MSLVILIDENISAAKAALHKMYPAVRSAHLAEAIAAGLNFGSFRSLKAKILGHGGLHPALAESDPAKFQNRIQQLGYTGISPLFFDQAFSSARLPVAPYIVVGKNDCGAVDKHFYDRRRRGWPMMIIKVARKYAYLEWDCITIDPSEEAHVVGKEQRDPVDEMYAQFVDRARHAPGNPIFFGKSFTGWAERLLPASAQLLAEDYFKLLYNPLNDQRRRAISESIANPAFR